MPFPFSVEDRIEVRIDSPEQAPRVAEGIEQWLLLLAPIGIAGVLLLGFVVWSAGRAPFRACFEVAAIRGLADGAAREYDSLRSR